MRFWNKKIKNVSEIARETGIEEQKIKELKEGKREIGGETMEKVLNAINKVDKKLDIERRVQRDTVMTWLANVDLKSKIKEFGFATQGDCAKAIGITQSSICMIANKNYKEYCKNIQKIYDFFQDDFNKNIKEPTNDNKVKRVCTPKLDYIKQFDLDELCKQTRYKTHNKLANKVGISRRSLESIFNGFVKKDSKCVTKLYDFLKTRFGEDNQKPSLNVEKKEDNIKILDDSKNVVGGAKIDKLEDNNKLEGKEKILIDLLMVKDNEIKRLKTQIERYEKLIDLIK